MRRISCPNAIIGLRHFLFVALFAVSIGAQSQSLSVFNADTAAIPARSKSIPGDSFFKYSYSEVLVNGACLRGLRNISAMAFLVEDKSGGNMFDSCDIYFGHTADTMLSHWHFDSTFCRVYSGSLNFDSLGWRQVMLDTLYPWDDQGHLVVAVNRVNRHWFLRSTFAAHIQPGCARYHVSNSTPCNLSNFQDFNSWNVNENSPVPIYRFTGSPRGVVLGNDTLYADTSAFLDPQCEVRLDSKAGCAQLCVSGIVGEATVMLMDIQGGVERTDIHHYAKDETHLISLPPHVHGIYYVHIATTDVDLILRLTIPSISQE